MAKFRNAMLLSLVFVPSAFAHGLSTEYFIVIMTIIALVSFIAIYLFLLISTKVSSLFNKEKSQGKIHIQIFYISIICLLVHNVICIIFNILGQYRYIPDISALISMATTPFLIIYLITRIILFLLKKAAKEGYRRDNSFENLLEKSRKNEEF
ncbi:MAG: hypothetical protein LBQ87_00160 [Candidatus Fibromonas sp.]|jgi:hypothetical protein|nr:hypothetical protein [Candidatus Fibromonas sp.]